MADTFTIPKRVRVRWVRQHRIIATRYPPIDLFERLDLPEAQKRALWALQARTNPRLLQETGDVRLVRPGDMVSGPHASVVMAAFTHIGFPSRFSDGRVGVYYAGRALETAIRETVFHRERDARASELAPDEWHMRAWIGQVRRPLYDVRGAGFESLRHPDPAHYAAPQAFARRLRKADPDAWGLVYRSVRHEGGDCIAAFRPPAVSLPVQGPLLVYVWNGERVTTVYEKSEPLLTF